MQRSRLPARYTIYIVGTQARARGRDIKKLGGGLALAHRSTICGELTEFGVTRKLVSRSAKSRGNHYTALRHSLRPGHGKRILPGVQYTTLLSSKYSQSTLDSTARAKYGPPGVHGRPTWSDLCSQSWRYCRGRSGGRRGTFRMAKGWLRLPPYLNPTTGRFAGQPCLVGLSTFRDS